MVELTASGPLPGLTQVEIGGARLSQVDLGCLTTVSPFKEVMNGLPALMREAHGLDLPAPNQVTGNEHARLMWFGRNTFLLVGSTPDARLSQYAAQTDQSDAWVALMVEGALIEDVLTRLVPIDLRLRHFGPGHTARTLVQHVNVSITRLSPQEILIMGFRSMAQTLWHDLVTAMESVAARS